MKEKKFLSLRAISREFPDLTRWKLEKILKDKDSGFPKPVEFHHGARPVWKRDSVQRWIDIQ